MREFLKRLWVGRRGTAAPEPAAAALAANEADGQRGQIQAGQDGRVAPERSSNPNLEGAAWRTRHGAAVDLDSFSPQSQEKLSRALAEQNGVPVFEGEVRHGYSKTQVADAAKCPRCGAPTRRCCAEFVYATDIAERAMLAPAGFFCSRCPTVVVDEEIIASGVKAGFKYEGVIGIDSPGKKEPALFETWNGRKPVYIFDEDQHCHGMGFTNLPLWHSGGPPARSAARKKKSRRRIANQSRRRNRQ